MLRPALLSLASTLALTPLVMRWLRRRGVLDVPNDRSSHVAPVPRGGGIALAAGTLIGVVVFPWDSPDGWLAVALAAVLFGAVGLAEDLVGLPVLPTRLLLQAGAAAIVLPFFLSGLAEDAALRWLAAPGLFLALLAYVNAYNFMDGIDGISVAQALVAGIAFSVLGEARSIDTLAAGGAILAAATAGFAPFNLPRARVFLGDVGSYFVGAMIAALAVVGITEGLPPEAVLGPLALYLVDTGSTLLRRIRQGDVWYEPHREHVYQRLVRLGWSHVRTTVLVAALIAACSGLGALSLTGWGAARVVADATMVVLLACYLALPALVGRRQRTAFAAGDFAPARPV